MPSRKLCLHMSLFVSMLSPCAGHVVMAVSCAQITAVGSAVQSQWDQDAKIQQNILGQFDQQDQQVQKQIGDQLAQDHQHQQALLNKNLSPVVNQSPILNQDQQKQDQEIQKQIADQLAQDQQAQQALLNKSPVSQSPVSSTSPSSSSSSSSSGQNVQNNVVPPQGRRLREVRLFLLLCHATC